MCRLNFKRNKNVKQIYFNENDNITEIASKLFEDENEPRSSAYKRKLIRPNIDWTSFISLLFLPLIILIFAILLSKHFYGFRIHIISLSVIVLTVYILVATKKMIIFLILVYQRYAPENIRNKCRFEPSCSEYMILSINKYGLLKGLKKGIKRCKRCNINDGGYDYP